jgi:hypothetical protein
VERKRETANKREHFPAIFFPSFASANVGDLPFAPSTLALAHGRWLRRGIIFVLSLSCPCLPRIQLQAGCFREGARNPLLPRMPN